MRLRAETLLTLARVKINWLGFMNFFTLWAKVRNLYSSSLEKRFAKQAESQTRQDLTAISHFLAQCFLTQFELLQCLIYWPHKANLSTSTQCLVKSLSWGHEEWAVKSSPRLSLIVFTPHYPLAEDKTGRNHPRDKTLLTFRFFPRVVV